MRIYLTVRADHIEARYGSGAGKDKETAEIRTEQELIDFASSHPHDYVLCSSTVDWPEDETTDQTIIRLCNAIRA